MSEVTHAQLGLEIMENIMGAIVTGTMPVMHGSLQAQASSEQVRTEWSPRVNLKKSLSSPVKELPLGCKSVTLIKASILSIKTW